MPGVARPHGLFANTGTACFPSGQSTSEEEVERSQDGCICTNDSDVDFGSV